MMFHGFKEENMSTAKKLGSLLSKYPTEPRPKQNRRPALLGLGGTPCWCVVTWMGSASFSLENRGRVRHETSE